MRTSQLELAGWRRLTDFRFVFRIVSLIFVIVAASIACVVAWTMMPALGVMLALPLVLAALFDRSAFTAWALQGIVFLAFVVARVWADETGIAWKGQYVADWDAALLVGSNPTAVLQRIARAEWVDVAASWTYISFFVVPTLIAMGLWWRGKGFRDFVVASAIVHAFAIILHYLVPTIPPWMASAMGIIEPIDRIFMDVMMPAAPQVLEAGYRASANDVAAMPSVHMAITTIAALAAVRLGRVAGVFGWIYAAIMLFAITYLGEHYIVDGIAGAAVAVIGWYVAPSVANWIFSANPDRISLPSRLPYPASQIAKGRPLRRQEADA